MSLAPYILVHLKETGLVLELYSYKDCLFWPQTGVVIR